MRFLKQTFLALIALSMMGAYTSQAQAQSNEQRRTAVQAFNSARELAQNNEYDASIAKFKEAIEAGQAAEAVRPGGHPEGGLAGPAVPQAAAPAPG